MRVLLSLILIVLFNISSLLGQLTDPSSVEIFLGGTTGEGVKVEIPKVTFSAEMKDTAQVVVADSLAQVHDSLGVNRGNIATNATDIATNVTDITNLRSDMIDSLANKEPLGGGGGGGGGFSLATITIGHPGSGAGLILYHDGDGDSLLNLAFGYIADSLVGNKVIELKVDSLLVDDTIFVQGGDWILRGSGKTRTKTSGAIYTFVDTVGYNNWTVEGISFEFDANCLGVFSSAVSSDSVTWLYNQFLNMTSASSKMYSLDSLCQGWNIHHNKFIGNKTTEFKGVNSVIADNYFGDVSGVNVLSFLAMRNIARDNTFERCFPDAGEGVIYMHDFNMDIISYGFYGGIIKGNTIIVAPRDSIAGSGILVEGQVGGVDLNTPVVDGNYILAGQGTGAQEGSGAISYGIYFSKVLSQGTITNNVILGPSIVGILLSNCNNIMVTNNKLWGKKPASTGHIGIDVRDNSDYNRIASNDLVEFTEGVDINNSTELKTQIVENWFQACTVDVDDNGTTTTIDDSRTD